MDVLNMLLEKDQISRVSETLTSEGVLDFLKDKNISTTTRVLETAEKLVNGETRDIDSNEEVYVWHYMWHLTKDIEVNDKIFKDKIIADTKRMLTSFITGNKNKVVVKRKYSSDKIGSKATNRVYRTAEEDAGIDRLRKFFYIPKNSGFLEMVAEDGDLDKWLSPNKHKPLKEIGKLLENTNKILDNEIDFTSDEVTLESANEELTNESSFITAVKDMFVIAMNKLKNLLANIFTKVEVDKIFYLGKQTDLKLFNPTVVNLSKYKFSQLENIDMPIMVGMKLDYRTIAFELKNISLLIADLKPMVDNFNSLLAKLVTNTNDIKLSNDRQLYKHNKDIFNIESKVKSILQEITEVRKPVDHKKFKDLFKNINSIKDIRDIYFETYTNLIKFDLPSYKSKIETTSTLLDSWMSTLHGDGNTVKASTNVVSIVRNSVQLLADVTTSIGIFTVTLNNTSAFFMNGLKAVEEEVKTI